MLGVVFLFSQVLNLQISVNKISRYHLKNTVVLSSNKFFFPVLHIFYKIFE